MSNYDDAKIAEPQLEHAFTQLPQFGAERGVEVA